MIGGAKDKVGRESEMIDPVGVRRECLGQGPVGSVPDFHCLVVRGCIDFSSSTPADAGYGAPVAAEDKFDSFGGGVPNSHRGVFGRGREARVAGRLEVVGLPCQTGDPFAVAF